MKISIIVPVFNGEKTITQNIAALKAQQNVNSHEIIVVDDGSHDSTAAILAATNGIRVISQKNKGPAAARNAGAKAATGDILVFTDSDTVPHPDWLFHLSAPFSDHKIQASAGTYTLANQDSSLARIIQQEIENRHRSYGDFIKFAGTYNLAIRKDVFYRIGGFNESYTQASGEDNGLCYRLIRAGHLIKYVEKAKVAHYHTEVLSRYLREQYRHGFWRARLYTDFPERLSGDSYTGSRDGLEVLFTLLLLAGSFASFFYRRLPCRLAALFAMFVLFTIETDHAEEIAEQPELRHKAAAVFLARSLARTCGLIAGVIHLGRAKAGI
jgi:glycosyltransferase involved in cell wall biosynthesis